jgi:DNA polymerase-3 subunit beta
MRFAIDTERLRPALQALQAIASHRETLPILSGILVQATESDLRLVAHNLSLGLEWTLPASIAEPGQGVLPARPWADLVRRLPSLSLDVEAQEGGVARLRWPQGEAVVPARSGDEFPLPPFLATPGVEVTGAEFRRGIEHVAFAAAQDASHPLLEGVRVRFDSQGLEFLATDRSRVAFSRRPVEGGTALEGVVVFPATALVTLGRLSGQVASYQLAWDAHGVTVRWEGVRLYSRLLDGSYPEVDRMIPEEYPLEAVVSRAAFLAACERVALLMEGSVPQVYLSVQPKMVEVRGESPSSRAREQVEARVVGDPLDIAFNARFLMDALSHLEGDEVVLEMRSSEELMRMRPVDRRDQYVVVLPMMMG